MIHPLSTYTDEIAEEICTRVSEGEPLEVICRSDGMPARRTVHDWLKTQAEFAAKYADARALGFDSIAVEALNIADDGRRDYTVDADGREVVDHDHIQRSKLRVDTRLKLLSKWDPKRYGDRQTLAGDPDSPLQTIHTIKLVDLQ